MSRVTGVDGAVEAAVRRVLDALDWPALAGIYCETGGDEFWREHREPVIHHGLRWGVALGRRLEAEGPAEGSAGSHPGRGRSLYVGAGVAEVPAMVFEHLQLGREVHACNLRSAECAVLNRGLAAADLPLRVAPEDATAWAALSGGDPGRGPRGEGAPLRADHVACVSVCSDPESFPTIAGLAYGALHPAQCPAADYTVEHTRLSGLVDRLLGVLDTGDGAWLTTTGEELPWFVAAAEARGLIVQLDEEEVPTAVVGDALCFLRFDPTSPA